MVTAQSYEKLSESKGKIIFIDVRTPKEYEEARIPGALIFRSLATVNVK